MLCAAALSFVLDNVCAQHVSQTIMTAYGCPEASRGQPFNSTYHWCNKTTPEHRKCGANGTLSHGFCEEEQHKDSGAPLLLDSHPRACRRLPRPHAGIPKAP